MKDKVLLKLLNPLEEHFLIPTYQLDPWDLGLIQRIFKSIRKYYLKYL